MRPAVLIYNPRAGSWVGARRAARLAALLRGGGWEAEVWPTAGPGDATALARRAADEAAAAVFAFGGDGTLREAAAGLLGGRAEPVLGFLPGGTTNVMHRELGLPRRAEDAARSLARAVPRRWDVGLCGPEPFLMQASAGLDAAILGTVGGRAKRWLGTAAVAWTGVRQWLGYRFPRIDLVADGEPLAGSLIVAGNIPHYGGPWRITPAARTDDGRLDLLVLHGAGRLANLGFARDLFLLPGRHLRRRDVSVRSVERVELRGPAALPLQVDGDLTRLVPPLEIRISEHRLRLLSLAGAGR